MLFFYISHNLYASSAFVKVFSKIKKKQSIYVFLKFILDFALEFEIINGSLIFSES